MKFHPTDTPRGMNPYNLEEITDEQQYDLNIFKLKQLRNDHRYLKKHPEIKCITNTLLRAILKSQPSHDIQEFFAEYVSENKSKLEKIITDARSNLTGSDAESTDSDEPQICKFNPRETEWIKTQPTIIQLYDRIQDMSCNKNAVTKKSIK